VEGLEDQLRKMKTQVDDLTRTNGELINTRNRLTTENSDLQRQVHELETNYGSFSKNRGQLQSQLDDAKSKLEEEIRVYTDDLFSLPPAFTSFCHKYLRGSNLSEIIFLLPSLLFSLSSVPPLPFPSRSAPSRKPARESGECCKLAQEKASANSTFDVFELH